MEVHKKITAWKVSKYGVLSGPYFSAFGLNTERLVFRPNAEKYGPEKTPYLDTFHAVDCTLFILRPRKDLILRRSIWHVKIPSYGNKSTILIVTFVHDNPLALRHAQHKHPPFPNKKKEILGFKKNMSRCKETSFLFHKFFYSHVPTIQKRKHSNLRLKHYLHYKVRRKMERNK